MLNLENIGNYQNSNLFVNEKSLEQFFISQLMNGKHYKMKMDNNGNMICIEYDNNNFIFANKNANLRLATIDTIKACEALGIPFQNQSLVSVCHSYLFEQTRIRKVSKALKKKIEKQAKGKCESCGNSFAEGNGVKSTIS